ncbi:MAG TPA: DciA family protein [Burkholderiales bacterium]|jgi:hypothetical protein|nr:DciA family protein [Burkholderiales bacterium]
MQRIGAYLRTANTVPAIGHAQRILELQRIYLEIAPAQLAHASRVGHCADGILILVADNGPAAAALRQLVPRLLAALRKRRLEITGIRIAVQVGGDDHSASRNAAAAAVPPAAAAGLQALADGLEPSPLKSALEILARRHRARSPR